MPDFAVSELRVYPLKSAAGIAVDAMSLDEFGAQFDRRWMLIDEHGRFLSQRRVPQLALVGTALEAGTLIVSAGGETHAIPPVVEPTLARTRAVIWGDAVDVVPIPGKASEWLATFLGRPCRLVFL